MRRLRPLAPVAVLLAYLVIMAASCSNSGATPVPADTARPTTPTTAAVQAAPTDTSPPPAPTNTEPPPPTATTPSLPKIGDTIKVGSWEVVVEKMESSKGFDWSGYKNMQTPKGIYAMVYLTATNVSQKTAAVNAFDYTLIDETGAEFASCLELGCFSYPKRVNRDAFGSQVPPRLGTKLLAIFDVAPGAKGLVLTIERDTKIALGDLK